MKKALIFSVFAWYFFAPGATFVFAQNQQAIREIRHAISIETFVSRKADLYLKLYDEYRRSQFDSAMAVVTEMTFLFKKQHYEPGILGGLLRWSIELARKTRFDEAYAKLEEARSILTTFKDPFYETYALMTSANLDLAGSKIQPALEACEKGLALAEKRRDTLNLIFGYETRARLRFNMGDMPGMQADALYALSLAEQARLPRQECAAHRMLSVVYIVYLSDSTLFFQHANRCLDLARRYYCTYDEAETLTQISAFNRTKGRFQEALDYGVQAVEKMKKVGIPGRYAAMLSGVGYVYLTMGNAEKARSWFEQSLDVVKMTGDFFNLAISYRGLGIAMYDAGAQKEGIDYLRTAYEICKQYGFREKQIEIGSDLDERYAFMRDFENAYALKVECQSVHDSIFNLKNALQIGKMQGKYEFQKREDSLLFEKRLGERDRERQRLLLQTQAGELLISQQLGAIQSLGLRQKTDSISKQQYALQLEQADKVAQLAKAGEAKQAEVQQRRTMLFIMSVLLALTILLIFFFRFRARLTQIKLRSQMAESEMTALRAQMNPHFIFNSLNSINAYVLRNESKTANAYLTEFAHLMRQILDNSAQDQIAVEQEIEFLQSYLQVEALRLDHKLTWDIQVSEALDIFDTKIPSMILQPYIENAIWHGIAQRPEGGKIAINIGEADSKSLILTVEDNGVGRARARELRALNNQTHNSKGLKITAERLALYDKKHGSKSSVTTTDLVDADGNPSGTRVEIRID
jgi:tetratricopeptide (TPR) repeat protein/two-component sensor histidine kinase